MTATHCLQDVALKCFQMSNLLDEHIFGSYMTQIIATIMSDADSTVHFELCDILEENKFLSLPTETCDI